MTSGLNHNYDCFTFTSGYSIYFKINTAFEQMSNGHTKNQKYCFVF